MPWKQMAGRYTREGDVRELLATIDDRFVVARPGDEVALAFDATALPRLSAGERRTFLFFAHGYSKEMTRDRPARTRRRRSRSGRMSYVPYPLRESYRTRRTCAPTRSATKHPRRHPHAAAAGARRPG